MKNIQVCVLFFGGGGTAGNFEFGDVTRVLNLINLVNSLSGLTCRCREGGRP